MAPPDRTEPAPAPTGANAADDSVHHKHHSPFLKTLLRGRATRAAREMPMTAISTSAICYLTCEAGTDAQAWQHLLLAEAGAGALACQRWEGRWGAPERGDGDL